MTEIRQHSSTPGESIIFSCDHTTYVAGENVIPEHGLVHVFEGELVLNDGRSSITLVSGDTAVAEVGGVGGGGVWGMNDPISL